jgi:hypothetical protein
MAFGWERNVFSVGKEQAITNPQHRPKSHQAHLEWTPSRMVNWAATLGPHTAQLFQRIAAPMPPQKVQSAAYAQLPH